MPLTSTFTLGSGIGALRELLKRDPHLLDEPSSKYEDEPPNAQDIYSAIRYACLVVVCRAKLTWIQLLSRYTCTFRPYRWTSTQCRIFESAGCETTRAGSACGAG